MPKSPIAESPKSNPYIKRGIDKKFLTPCRQPGLSRKRKTPSSQNSSPLVTQSSELPTLKDSKSEPKTFQENKDQQIKKGLVLNEEASEENAKRILLDTSTTVESHNLNSENEDQNVTHKKHNSAKQLVLDQEKPKENKNKNNIEVDLDFKIANDERKISKNKSSNKKVKDKKAKTVLKNKTENNMKSNMEKTEDLKECPQDKIEKDSIHETVKNQQEAVVLLKNCDKIEKKSIPAGEKNSHIKEVFDFKGFPAQLNSCKSCEILLNKNKSNPEPPKKESPIKRKTVKLRHSLSLKRENSNSEESKSDKAFFMECQNESKNYLEEIKTLKTQIKEKQKLLADLKQAEIYKRKHDLTELQKLTALWKQGCKSALIDLLPQMQKYVEIDMETLLKNLSVPPEIMN